MKLILDRRAIMSENKNEKKDGKLSGFLHKAADISKKTAEIVTNEAKKLQEKAKNDSYERKKKKLNPLFPEIFSDKKFNLPNVIKIVDDAERRAEEICDGAIGWLDTENGVEILYLYDEFVSDCGLEFIPNYSFGAVYCVDNFDRTKFINADTVFSKAQDEKLAELENVAYRLGAKKCSIEIAQSEEKVSFIKKSLDVGAGGVGVGLEGSLSYDGGNRRSGKTEVVFNGSDTPVHPELKWFKHDNNIINLIEMRCSDANSVKSRVLEISGSTFATMSQQTAVAIDCVLKKHKSKMKSEMAQHASREMNSKLIFSVEF